MSQLRLSRRALLLVLLGALFLVPAVRAAAPRPGGSSPVEVRPAPLFNLSIPEPGTGRSLSGRAAAGWENGSTGWGYFIGPFEDDDEDLYRYQ